MAAIYSRGPRSARPLARSFADRGNRPPCPIDFLPVANLTLVLLRKAERFYRRLHPSLAIVESIPVVNGDGFPFDELIDLCAGHVQGRFQRFIGVDDCLSWGARLKLYPQQRHVWVTGKNTHGCPVSDSNRYWLDNLASQSVAHFQMLLSYRHARVIQSEMVHRAFAGRDAADRSGSAPNPNGLLISDFLRIVYHPLLAQSRSQRGKSLRSDFNHEFFPFELRIEKIFPTVRNILFAQ